jgi:serine protease Do
MKTLRLPIAFVLILSLLLSGCGPVITLGASAVRELANEANIVPVVQQLTATSLPVLESDTEADTPAVVAPPSAEALSGALAVLESTYEDVYNRVNPSVVNIQTNSGLGSGFVWDSLGHIVTNNHVVEGAARIRVIFADETTLTAELVGSDPQSDLAVLKVNRPAGELFPVEMADSSQVKVGQIAIAIGNPFGLAGTMTSGIISARARSLPVSTGLPSGGTYTIPDIIQTDAAINPGNSGGVLVNALGQVTGVTTAIRSSVEANSGIGFVVPSNIVSRVVPELIASGKFDHPRLGIAGTTLTPDLLESLGLPAGQRGVVVMDVTEGGPASQAGMRGSSGQRRGGDVITAIDGQPIRNFEDLSTYLFYNTEVGQIISVTILRGGSEQTLQLTLGILSLTP